MSDAWKHDLTERLKQGLALCPHEHTAHTEQVQLDGQRYWLTCDDEVLGEIILSRAEEPASWFERWSSEHRYEVARGFLHRLLVAEAEPSRADVEALEATEEFARSVNEAVKILSDRIAVLEAAVETQGERLGSLDARLVATDKIVHSLPVGGGWDR